MSTEGVIHCSLAFIHSCSGHLSAGSGSHFNIGVGGRLHMTHLSEKASCVRMLSGSAIQFSTEMPSTPVCKHLRWEDQLPLRICSACVCEKEAEKGKSVKETRGVWKEASIYLWRRDIESDPSKRYVLAGHRSHTAQGINTQLYHRKERLESSAIVFMTADIWHVGKWQTLSQSALSPQIHSNSHLDTL